MLSEWDYLKTFRSEYVYNISSEGALFQANSLSRGRAKVVLSTISFLEKVCAPWNLVLVLVSKGLQWLRLDVTLIHCRLALSKSWYSITDLGRMESWDSFCGKEGHTNAQTWANSEIEPGTLTLWSEGGDLIPIAPTMPPLDNVWW